MTEEKQEQKKPFQLIPTKLFTQGRRNPATASKEPPRAVAAMENEPIMSTQKVVVPTSDLLGLHMSPSKMSPLQLQSSRRTTVASSTAKKSSSVSSDTLP